MRTHKTVYIIVAFNKVLSNSPLGCLIWLSDFLKHCQHIIKLKKNQIQKLVGASMYILHFTWRLSMVKFFSHLSILQLTENVGGDLRILELGILGGTVLCIYFCPRRYELCHHRSVSLRIVQCRYRLSLTMASWQLMLHAQLLSAIVEI